MLLLRGTYVRKQIKGGGMMEMENKKEEKKMGFWDILKKILDVGNKNDDGFSRHSRHSCCNSFFSDDYHDPFYPFSYYGSFSSYFNRLGGDD